VNKSAGAVSLGGRSAAGMLEEKIGYSFRDPFLLECALTHTSYANEQKIHRFSDYERIEFLGDAVLELVSSEFLYRNCPDRHEGEMTKIRSTLVCETALACCARDIGLEAYIRLGRGEEQSGGRKKDSIVSDVMEAVIGALYLDSGELSVPRDFIMKYILADLNGRQLFVDSKSALQEKVQQAGKEVSYELLEESGPGHMRHFRVAVCIDGSTLAEGEGKSKKDAEQNAAYKALRSMQDRNNSTCI
jgi:ribonuclease-3